MVRRSKQEKRRNVSPRRPRVPGVKTGAKQDKLEAGFKAHANAIGGEQAQTAFIPKIN